MKAIRLLDTVEHRFIHDPSEPPSPMNDVAIFGARMVTQSEVPDTDFLASVWKVPLGAEMLVPNRCATKLIDLGYAEEIVTG